MRRLGAIAGLITALIAVAVMAMLGLAGLASVDSDSSFAVASIIVGAFIAGVGWLVEPATSGSMRDDLVAGVSFAITSALVYLVIGTIGAVWTDVGGGRSNDPFDILVGLGGYFAYGLLFVPVAIVVMAPIAMVWVTALRVLRRTWPDGQPVRP